jgi:predicted TIM-barrel fold metal-dependent hydrolase
MTSTRASARRIDVHHHYIPPAFLAQLAIHLPQWTGGPPIPDWTIDRAREVMDAHGIETAMGSVVPSVYWGDRAAAAHWARHCNEFSARIVADDPVHFGALATVPLPDTAAACREVEYALDVLKLDGVVLFASTGNQYLGDPEWDELFQELERRRAVVLVHPSTTPPGSIVPRLSIPWGLVEFIMDTTRAITNLLYSGTLARYPSIRYIVSHAGGAVPYIAWRLALGELMIGNAREAVPGGTMALLKRLYFDTALSTSNQVFAALREFADPTHVLFGSDYPMVPVPVVTAEVAAYESSTMLDEAQRRAIDRENALKLFPRLVTQQVEDFLPAKPYTRRT